MNDKDFLNVDGVLEKLSNGEYYYIIACLLGLGDPGFAPEKLFLSFDETFEPNAVKFFFLTQELLETEKGEELKVCFHLGKIDSDFDEIELYSGQCSSGQFDLENLKTNGSFISKSLIERTRPNEFRPVTFLKGIRNIVSQKDFKSRRNNDLFSFYWNTPIPEGIKYDFQFGRIGSLGTDFSGDYFLIVLPDGKDESRAQVNSFKVHDNFDRKVGTTLEQHRVDVTHSFIDSQSIQLYYHGESASMFVEEAKQNEDFEKHKLSIWPVLTKTVLSMLPDLSPASREKLVEGETPEELVDYLKEKYEREFDLNVVTLGIASAHEIAWQETMAVLNDEFWD